MRVFGDRLNNDHDLNWLQQLVQQLLRDTFGWKEPSEGSSMCHDDSACTPAHGSSGTDTLGPAPPAVRAALFDGDDQILFGDIEKIGKPRAERVYEKLPSISKLASLLEVYLEEFNTCRGRASSAALAAAAPSGAGSQQPPVATAAVAAAEVSRGSSQLQLVFFKDAVLHVVRLARVLRQAR
jgi:hypothetical protein